MSCSSTESPALVSVRWSSSVGYRPRMTQKSVVPAPMSTIIVWRSASMP